MLFTLFMVVSEMFLNCLILLFLFHSFGSHSSQYPIIMHRLFGLQWHCVCQQVNCRFNLTIYILSRYFDVICMFCLIYFTIKQFKFCNIYVSWYFEEGGAVLWRGWCVTFKRVERYFEEGDVVLWRRWCVCIILHNHFFFIHIFKTSDRCRKCGGADGVERAPGAPVYMHILMLNK